MHLLKLVLTILALHIGESQQFLHTQGTTIVDSNGKEVYLTGINLGNWLLWEGFMMMGNFGYETHTQLLNNLTVALGSKDKALEFEHQWRLNYVTDKTLEEISGLGYNAVRVPYHYNMFWKNGQLSDDGFVYFDRLVGFCKKHNVYILLDMHAAPGSQNPGDHSDNMCSNSKQPRWCIHFWDGDNVNIAAQVWKHIASRYKDEETIWGYDILNEPLSPSYDRKYELLPSLIKLRNAIREVDNNHIIVAEGGWWASDMSLIDWTNPDVQSKSHVSSRWDNNLVFETHHYVGGDASKISALDGRVAIANKLNLPLILGEYGEDKSNVLRQLADYAESHMAGGFAWTAKKMFHDRTLWTVQPNDPYNQVLQCIKQQRACSDDVYQGFIKFAQTNIQNGAQGLQWHQDFYDATKYRKVPKGSYDYGDSCKHPNDGQCGSSCSDCRWSWPSNDPAKWASKDANCRCKAGAVAEVAKEVVEDFTPGFLGLDAITMG